MNLFKKGLLFTVLSVFASFVFAGEGMWLPLLLKQLNEREMRSMGMKMSAEDIYSVNKGSLKDAIAQFGGGCTSEVISAEGLLLTNHHCGYGQIQSHTTLQNNYLQNGFWAASKDKELPCQGLTATFIVRMEDVTLAALEGIETDFTPSQRQSTIDKNLNKIRQEYIKESYEELLIRPFFEGNQYFLFVTVTYKDVRLVGAPPSSIGNFGVDTDNWVWPRHTGDFSLFRIYADQNNLPAEYAASNKPYQPKHFLPISLGGVKEGDFTLVFGFPGRTQEYLPSFEVRQIVDVLDPARIKIRDEALKIMGEAMRSDAQTKIQYAAKYARIANYWKKWQGEVLGLKATNAVAKKEAYEMEFNKRLASNAEWKTEFQNLLTQFSKLYSDIEPYVLAKEYYNEICLRNNELLAFATALISWVDVYYQNGPEEFAKRKSDWDKRIPRFFKDYQPQVDQKIFTAMVKMYAEDMPADNIPDYLMEQLQNSDDSYAKISEKIYGRSNLTDQMRLIPLMSLSPALLVEKLENDPAYLLAKAFKDVYTTKIAPKHDELRTKIDELQRQYMAAQMQVFNEKTFYPDANSTLRVTYGKVQGYEPRDAVAYKAQTYLEGVMEKYKPGDYEFDVPAKLIELFEKKDYGRYGENGKLPICFIGSNHTTGGNSGSPAIDANGNLIGLNFDRVWEGTMSDINYDISLCRNIMVDIRYVLFLIDKFAGAKHLVDEMKLVYP